MAQYGFDTPVVHIVKHTDASGETKLLQVLRDLEEATDLVDRLEDTPVSGKYEVETMRLT